MTAVPNNYKEWVNIAQKDWNRVTRNLKDEDVEAAAFFLQQSLEKYLKAFLLKHGWKLKKIHELDSLLDEAIKYNPELQNFYNLCERVSGYYFAERYPPLSYTSICEEDIKNDLQETEIFIQLLSL